jgi:hypothetical protein
LEKQLHRRAKELGFTLVRNESPAAAEDVESSPAITP